MQNLKWSDIMTEDFREEMEDRVSGTTKVEKRIKEENVDRVEHWKR